MSSIAYLNGCFFREEEAGIKIHDRGLLLGDGLFETLRCYAGYPFSLKAHWGRLEEAAKTMGIPLSVNFDKATEIIHELLLINRLSQASVRITLTRGPGPRGLLAPKRLNPTLLITTADYTPPQQATFRLGTSRFTRNERSPYSHLKTLSYTEQAGARLEAQAQGFDDAVMLNTRGQITCTSMANIFYVKDGRLNTPVKECGLIPGITRAQIIELGLQAMLDITEVKVELAELLCADEIFITNSLMGIMPISCINDTLFAGERGEVTSKLQHQFSLLLTSDGSKRK